MARWVRRRDPAGRVLAIANQKTGVLERFGLTRAEANRAAWTIDAGGHKLAAASAVNRVLRELGGGWRAMAALERLGPIAASEEALYVWFARNRSRFDRFGTRPECDEPAAGCE